MRGAEESLVFAILETNQGQLDVAKRMHEAISGVTVATSYTIRTHVRESADWLNYFRRNAESLSPIPWEVGAELSTEGKKAIAKSIQAFQLGESSEGRHLQRSADVWAKQNGDSYYGEAIRMFIKEEQRHAADLGRFMDINGIDPIGKAWTDTLFRCVRRLAKLELSIMVLLTAEIVAQVYYVALRDSTNSTILRSICEQILRDEAEHVRFQCERLAIMARTYNCARLVARYGFQRFFMLATLPIVWASHRHAYRAGGFSFDRFVSETWLAFSRSVPSMHPKSYE